MDIAEYLNPNIGVEEREPRRHCREGEGASSLVDKIRQLLKRDFCIIQAQGRVNEEIPKHDFQLRKRRHPIE